MSLTGEYVSGSIMSIVGNTFTVPIIAAEHGVHDGGVDCRVVIIYLRGIMGGFRGLHLEEIEEFMNEI